jgi:hypothetical protein
MKGRAAYWASSVTCDCNSAYYAASDLFFMRHALEHGMTYAEVAGFLSRDETEVRNKAKQMKIPYKRSRHYCHYRLRRGR